jgi:chromate transporter
VDPGVGDAARLTPTAARAAELRGLAALFLKLGVIGFGGPAAHIAMMRDEVVRRRGWLSDQEFLDLLGATNLIPGPNSTEMAMHVGSVRAGLTGLIVAGACFIAPAALIVGMLAALYVRYGTTPEGGWLLYGIKPIIIAIVVQALWRLGRSALRTLAVSVIAAAALALYLLGINELFLLAAGGIVALVLLRGTLVPAIALLAGPAAVAGAPFQLLKMFLLFLKTGSVLYGSGYVLLAFLRGDFVSRLGWLTDQQLLNAVAIGQFTPGPVLTTATFVGYLLAGIPGAVLATIGIFLPGFVFVALSHPVIPRLRRSRTAGALLDGVNAAALGLMAGVTLQLGRAALVDVWTVLLALAAAVALLRTKVNSVWLIGLGAAAGLILHLLRG